MAKYLIESHHGDEPLACARVVKVFLATGSHYLTNADWGCADGEHAAWLVVEAGSKEEARTILPAAYRAEARITTLEKFTPAQVDRIMAQHGG